MPSSMYGSAVLTDATKKKLDIIVKALNDRPALKMDIVGHADPEKDREGLKQDRMLKKIKAQKIKEMLAKNSEAPSLDSITVTSEEYPVYLKRAYKEEKFPKPRNMIGMAKDLPVPEMEKLMLTNMKVTDEDLQALAEERARSVRDYLLQPKQLDPERIFIVESKTLEVEKKEGAKNSRTDFSSEMISEPDYAMGEQSEVLITAPKAGPMIIIFIARRIHASHPCLTF